MCQEKTFLFCNFFLCSRRREPAQEVTVDRVWFWCWRDAHTLFVLGKGGGYQVWNMIITFGFIFCLLESTLVRCNHIYLSLLQQIVFTVWSFSKWRILKAAWILFDRLFPVLHGTHIGICYLLTNWFWVKSTLLGSRRQHKHKGNKHDGNHYWKEMTGKQGREKDSGRTRNFNVT